MTKSEKAAESAVVACRPGCGACCIAPSISSPIPGMPGGKAAGVRCVQLSSDNRCRLFADPRRPVVCSSLRPSVQMCGNTAAYALAWLAQLESATAAYSISKSIVTLSTSPCRVASTVCGSSSRHR